MSDRGARAPTKRAHTRVTLDAFVRVAGADRDYAFRTRDLSESGLFLYTRVGHLYPFVVGSVLDIELHYGANVLTLRGHVVRLVGAGTLQEAHDAVGFGVRLDEPDEPTKVALEALVASERG
jgi:hypothetical protein